MSIARLKQEEPLGRYKLAARLGRGGMAELFLGRLVGAGGFEKLVAIKRMLPHLSEDPQFVEMFQNEGRIAASLGHPNLCEVYELGEVDGQLFLAMEFLRGLPWSEIVAAIPDHPQPPFVRFVAGMLVQACEGLHCAHTATDDTGAPRPIVHRDVSPSNLMITEAGIVKLLDFGVSKVLTERKRTQTGMLKGKLTYMAPEQIRNLPLDARADIFAIGVIAWEAFAGRGLFDRPSDYDVFKAVVEEAIPRLPGSGPVYAALDEVIGRALARDRDQRQPSARAFADDIRRAISAVGEPMPPSEMQIHLQQWLGGNLAKRNRELAELLAHLRGDSRVRPEPTDDSTTSDTHERTGVHVGAPEEGVRLRDRSVVVSDRSSAPRVPARSNDTLEDARTASPNDTLDNVIAAIRPGSSVPTDELPSTTEATAPRVAPRFSPVPETLPPHEPASSNAGHDPDFAASVIRDALARRGSSVPETLLPRDRESSSVRDARGSASRVPEILPPHDPHEPRPRTPSRPPGPRVPETLPPMDATEAPTLLDPRSIPRDARIPDRVSSIAPTKPRPPLYLEMPREAPPPARGWRAWAPAIVLAVLAIASGVIVALVGP